MWTYFTYISAAAALAMSGVAFAIVAASIF